MFFWPQKVEKTTPKSCILMDVGSFFFCSPDCPKKPRTSFPFYKFFYPIVSAKVSAWVWENEREKKNQKFGALENYLVDASQKYFSQLVAALEVND